ncbi:hypothetical protein [Bacillus sp. FJAT-27231]|uniref:hypothetical protein n=1 Tax=Bacillus sp. FJAT-27231 TaxID=1679168 RepID=UPI000AD6AFB5|nr:hypothetical protein [Bacillus sp. FJAT-27231]
MEKNIKVQNELQFISSLQRNIDIITAILLLTGQITIVGIFITSGGFSLTLSGPLLGGSRARGIKGSQTLDLTVDLIDILIAILLIKDDIRVVTLGLAPGTFSLNVSGPIFGLPRTQATLPYLKKNYTFF